MIEIKTKRLLLRPWREEDFTAFAQLNGDVKVMEYFPSTLSRQESDDLGKRLSSKLEEQGWGLWAVSIPDIADFIGFIGLNKVPFTAPFTPAVEVGWRLAHKFWGQGYATEGALASLKYGFETLDLEEIVSFTATANMRSRNVMEKIGMHRSSQDDFDHPRIAPENNLRRHVLYRIHSKEWQSSTHS